MVAWSESNGFTFSPEKTVCMHFCRRPLHPDPELTLNGNPLTICDQHTFLGVIFDKHLTFLPHIMDLRNRCLRSMNILRVLSNTAWGADRTSLLKVYRSVIRSKLDYGCCVYGSARNSYLSRLNYVHHQALRVCCGAFRTSPISSLYVETCEPSLSFRRNMLSACYYFRVLSNRSHPLRRMFLNCSQSPLFNVRRSCIPPLGSRILKFLPESYHNIEIHDESPFSVPPWCQFDVVLLHPFRKFLKSNTPDFIFRALFSAHRHMYSDYIPVYTDGSKAESHVGYAFACESVVVGQKLHDFTSVFTSEVTAIYRAIQYIAKNKFRKVIIYSDSWSALQALIEKTHNHAYISDIRILLKELCQNGFEILFCWIPSHVGIQGNEIVDIAAKSANESYKQAIPYADVRSSVRKWLFQNWQNQWNLETKNKLHTVKPFIDLWCSSLNRRCDVILTRLRIGHSRITHKYILLKQPPPACSRCGDSLTIRHILIECQTLDSLRLKYFNTVVPCLPLLIGHEDPTTEKRPGWFPLYQMGVLDRDKV
ncbi:uncharacterized protein LOC129969045 [Argiope bruennichi]|uniref:uncharacterized protein LOC129969045 n=1 Tax=Argiope bruennichi TaxID=94029 RepID=UPI00249550C6|nr:uncharacterized protein LOC129969045 [Argiope bruennichi]